MKILAAILLLASSPAFASLPGKSTKVVCTFTEPFFTIRADLKKKSMVIESIGEFPKASVITDRKDVIKNLIVRDGGHADIEILFVDEHTGQKPKTILHISTIEKGSDGMSEHEYDAAAYSTLHGNVHEGGCDFVK